MKTIVIVEDEFRIREGLGKLINRLNLGFQVVGEAENGIEGLKMIQDLRPDLVITDIRMPKMDGLEMIEKTRQMRIDNIFVILSGYEEFSYAQKAISLGVREYLLKPVMISEVRALLEHLKPKEEKEALFTGAYSHLVTGILNYIDHNYALHISFGEIAQKYKMTPQYLGAVFAKETGMTFSAYLRQIRMEKAKELIGSTNMKIYEIAIAVGYPEQKYFSKVFKEYTGVSAKQYLLSKDARRR
ncbi:MAG TPA: response regulator [Lachnospiraceae bacterium]